MNKVRLQKFQTSKLYKGPHDLSIAYNNDECHEKIWAQKVQQAKHVQQKKQIDKILHNIVKERLFGNFLSQQTRISTQGYYTLDTISRQQVNPSKFKHQRRFSRAQTQDMRNYMKNSRQSSVMPSRDYSITLEPISRRQKGKTLDPITKRQTGKTLDLDSKNKPSMQLYKKQSLNIQQSGNILGSIQNPSKKLAYRFPKQLILSKIPQFSQFFRRLTGNNFTMIYDLRITKQPIMERCQGFIHTQLMEKMYFFFSMPSSMGYRQYCNVVQNIINAPLKDIYFFLFRTLDTHKTGFLSISDFFRALQFYPDNTYVESEIYSLLNYMKDFNKEARMSSKANVKKKPSVEQVLVTNHSLRLEDIRELVKEQSHQLSAGNCVRNTCYSNSILSLEHDVNYRLKNQQIQDNRQSSQANKSKKKGGDKGKTNSTLGQEGLRLSDFIKFFNGKKPKMFCVFAQVLAGVNPQQYQ